MADKTLKQNYKDIANAIRAKTGENGLMKPTEMPGKIETIETGIEPTGTKDITANGNYDVTEFANANVNVPNPSKGTLSISDNGLFNVKNFEFASVQIHSPLEELPRFEDDNSIASLGLIEQKVVEIQGRTHLDLDISFVNQGQISLVISMREDGEYEVSSQGCKAQKETEYGLDEQYLSYESQDNVFEGRIYLPFIASPYNSVNVEVENFVSFYQYVDNPETGEYEYVDSEKLARACPQLANAVVFDALGNQVTFGVNLLHNPEITS